MAFSFERIEDACKWLAVGRLDAVVYDRPNLRCYGRNEGKGKMVVVGRTLRPKTIAWPSPRAARFGRTSTAFS